MSVRGQAKTRNMAPSEDIYILSLAQNLVRKTNNHENEDMVLEDESHI